MAEKKFPELNKNQKPILTDKGTSDALKKDLSNAMQLIEFKRPDLAIKHLELLSSRIHAIALPTDCDRFPDCPNFRKLANGKATLHRL